MKTQLQRWLLALCIAALVQPAAALPLAANAAPQLGDQGQSTSSIYQKGADDLAQQLKEYVDREMVLGAEILVMHQGKVLVHDGYGWRDREDELKMVPDTIFNIRSMTKPLTGAAAQILIDEGKLNLDDPVSKFIPSFSEHGKDELLVKHLMQHRSGLPLTMFETSVDEFENITQIADAAASSELRFEPGTQFYYSDAGSDVLGAVVAAASGQDLDPFVVERLLQPLAMHHSFYNPGDDPKLVGAMASLYVGFAETWIPNWKPEGKSMYPFAWGSQSVYSTPKDYAKFLQMWMNGGLVDGKQLLSKAAVTRTLKPKSKMLALGSDKEMPTGFPGMTTSYGQMSVLYLNEQDDVKVIGHSGSDGTLAYAWPDRELIVCMFTQSRGQSIVFRFEADLHRFLLEPSTNLPAPAELQPMLGLYKPETGPFAGRKIEVLMYNGAIAVDVPGQMLFQLTDADEDGWRKMVFEPRAKVKFEQQGNEPAEALLFLAPGVTEPDRVPRWSADMEQKTANLDPKYHRYFGVYWDEEGQAEVTFHEHEGKLAVTHPKMPMPLTFTGPSDDGFWAMDLNPAVRIRFEDNEKGEIDRYDVHVQGQVVPRKRLRD
jgi:CubicO group peptidase (beta-lactamase class C family)